MSDATLVFIHGAAGYVDDRLLAENLAAQQGLSLRMPRMPDEDMSLAAWADAIRSVLVEVGPGDEVVAHSFGASLLVRVLAERQWPVQKATLLASPDWSRLGWDVADYAYDGPAPATALTLHHCRDDEVVPFFHLWLWAEKLPTAEVHGHARGGHQFDGLAETLARRS